MNSKLKLIISMFTFGTIGLFIRNIPLSSAMIAMVRGFTGALFLVILLLIKKQKISKKDIKNNLFLLCLSGAAIGANWIFLFEAYRYTSVATATLCYYLEPVFVVLISPLVLKEKLTAKKLICSVTALFGMVLVSGVITNGADISQLKGVFLGIGAAMLYTSVVLMNKKLGEISAYDMTIVQLFSAAVVVVPYVIVTENFSEIHMTASGTVLLLFVGIVHTGICYALYFSSMQGLKAQTVAIMSYIDPVVAIILSALILKERLDIYGIIGAVLILGSTFISEMNFKIGKKDKGLQ